VSFLDTRYVLATFPRVAIDKIFNQERDVLFSFSKRRNLNGENMQAVIQIATERPRMLKRLVPVTALSKSRAGFELNRSLGICVQVVRTRTCSLSWRVEGTVLLVDEHS